MVKYADVLFTRSGHELGGADEVSIQKPEHVSPNHLPILIEVN
jgi:hypothetical protein